MKIKKLSLLILTFAFFFGAASLNAGCREDCVQSGQNIAQASGCGPCGVMHALACIEFECLAE